MRSLRVLALVALVAGPAVAETPRGAPPADAMDLLGSIDVLLTAENVAQAGVTEALAAAVLADASQRRYVRTRAATALAFSGTPTARATLERAAAAPDVEPYVRAQAAISVARAWGGVDAPRVQGFLSALRIATPAPVAEAAEAELARLPLVATPVALPAGR